MPGNQKSNLELVKESLQGSGFPFQTAVVQVIRTSPGWSIHATEYPWIGPKQDDQFLDIVATSNRFVLTVECKKTRQDTFTFLRPSERDLKSGHTSEFRCLNFQKFTPIPGPLYFTCETRGIFPNSPSCEFCVVNSKKSDRLLERDASLVIRATEAFVQDSQEISQISKNLGHPFPLLPVIVTNAQLFAVQYAPSGVSLETGEFHEIPKEIEEAPWVRFSKAFTTSKRRDYANRSVFVVSAKNFAEFLGLLEFAPEQPKEPMRVPFYKGAL